MQINTPPFFQPGEIITVLFVNRASSTSKIIVTVEQKDDDWYISDRKNRWQEHISALKDALIFRGDNIPYTTDNQCSVSASNAGINLVSKNDPQSIREWLTTNNLNPHFSGWEHIYLCAEERVQLDSVYVRLFNN